jgi:hypothetical protein
LQSSYSLITELVLAGGVGVIFFDGIYHGLLHFRQEGIGCKVI